jgi:hypothetical protein
MAGLTQASPVYTAIAIQRRQYSDNIPQLPHIGHILDVSPLSGIFPLSIIEHMKIIILDQINPKIRIINNLWFFLIIK